MITNLKIRNFTLIDSLDIDFLRGYSVITGETGAGKSFILGALGMLLGQRADSKVVKSGEQRCSIEAHFNITGYGLKDIFDENELDYDEEDCILRRELTAAGKSRSFINDTPVSLAVMKQLGEHLVDIHSQHQNLLLRDADFQLSVVDIIAGNEKERNAYSEAFNAYKKAKHDLDMMLQQMDSNMAQEDYMRFQHQELEDANLTEGEQEELEQLQEAMTHSEEIKSALYTATNILDGEDSGAVQQLRVAANALSKITSVFPDAEEIAERLNSAYIELNDMSGDISSMLDKVDFDPQEQARVDSRLDIIYSLQRKHHKDTVEELIAMRDDLARKLSLIDNSEEEIENQRALVSSLYDKARKLADALTSCRKKAGKKVEDEMKKCLIPLGIPNVQFKVEIASAKDENGNTKLTASGADHTSFLFSANKGTAMMPVSQVASGGEIARVMLSLKYMISSAVSLPTIIFDEIDTGVSGKIAEAMAKIMSEMGEGGRQVISITHLPQIAALGKAHYKVEKNDTADGTRTTMSRLTDEERITEIAQMISGSSISEAARQQARELVATKKT